MEGKAWYEVYAILSQYHCCVQRQGLLSSFYYGRRDTSTRESHALLLERERKIEELFLCLLFLNCFQLKITLRPKWYILGWHIRIPFIRVKWEKSIRPRAFYGSREWNGIESKWVWQQEVSFKRTLVTSKAPPILADWALDFPTGLFWGVAGKHPDHSKCLAHSVNVITAAPGAQKVNEWQVNISSLRAQLRSDSLYVAGKSRSRVGARKTMSSF